VAIVGAGLAGLAAAHRLRALRGWTSTVYDARDRVGGRTLTLDWPDGRWIEAGASFMNSNERTIRALVRQLGLEEIDLFASWPTGKTRYRYDGADRTRSEVVEGKAQVDALAWRQFRTLGWPVTRARSNPAARAWDRVSVREWISDHVPGGEGSPLGSWLRQTFEVEYAGPAERASAIALIAELGGTFWGAGYDERWTVRGGVGRISERLESRLPAGTVRRGHRLRAVAVGSGGVRLTFDRSGGGTREVTADHVVLALPFTTLRRCDLSGAGFDPAKRAAIRGLGMGTGTKFHAAYSGRPWEPGFTGDSYSDLVTGSSWPGQVGQPGTDGILVALNGGAASASLRDEPAHGPASDAIRERFVRAAGVLFPGSAASATGLARFDNWPADPWVRGSYSFYEVGQFTTIAGEEARRVGRVHLAGEHTATYTQRGTMNGAVRSGYRAAGEIVSMT
jgi:monoamine oxidase